LKTGLQVAFTPPRNLHAPDAKLLGDVFVLKTLSRQQHDVPALRQPDADALGSRQPRQFLLLLIRQLNRRGNSHLLSPMQTEVEHWRRTMQLGPFKNQTLR